MWMMLKEVWESSNRLDKCKGDWNHPFEGVIASFDVDEVQLDVSNENLRWHQGCLRVHLSFSICFLPWGIPSNVQDIWFDLIVLVNQRSHLSLVPIVDEQFQEEVVEVSFGSGILLFCMDEVGIRWILGEFPSKNDLVGVYKLLDQLSQVPWRVQWYIGSFE